MTREWLWGIILFSRAVIFGSLLGVYYDFFRVMRILFTHPAWLVAVEDLLFFLPASLTHIFFHFARGEGETRWFAVLGVVLGFLLYLASAGKIVRKGALWIKRLVLKKIAPPLQRRRERIRNKRKEKREERKLSSKRKKSRDRKDKRS